MLLLFYSLHSCVDSLRGSHSPCRFLLEQRMTDQFGHIPSIRFTGGINFLAIYDLFQPYVIFCSSGLHNIHYRIALTKAELNPRPAVVPAVTFENVKTQTKL